jgi:hypothetical protein
MIVIMAMARMAMAMGRHAPWAIVIEQKRQMEHGQLGAVCIGTPL